MIRNIRLNAMVIAVVLCFFGIIFVLTPGRTTQAICLILAVGLIVLAVSFLFRFFKNHKSPDYIGNEMSIGIALFIISIFLVLQANQFTAVIPLILGFIIVFDSAAKMQNAYYLKKTKSRKWFSIGLLSLINLGIGMFLLWDPMYFRVYNRIGLVVALGVGLLFSGISDLVMIIVMMRESKKQELLFQNEK